MDRLNLLDFMNRDMKDAVSRAYCKNCGYQAVDPEYVYCPECGEPLKNSITFEAYELPEEYSSKNIIGVKINGKDYKYRVKPIDDPNYKGKLKGKNISSKEAVEHLNSMAEKASPGRALQFIKKYWELYSEEGLQDSEESLNLTAKIEELSSQVAELEKRKRDALSAGESVEDIEKEIWSLKLKIEELKKDLSQVED